MKNACIMYLGATLLLNQARRQSKTVYKNRINWKMINLGAYAPSVVRTHVLQIFTGASLRSTLPYPVVGPHGRSTNRTALTV